MAGYVRMILADLTEATSKEVHWGRRAAARAFEERAFEESASEQATRDRLAALRERDLARARGAELAAELHALGVRIVDSAVGIAGFPFRWSRNRRSRRIRQALFLLRLDDDPAKGIHSWRFCGEREERQIPPHWLGQMESPILAEVGA